MSNANNTPAIEFLDYSTVETDMSKVAIVGGRDQGMWRGSKNTIIRSEGKRKIGTITWRTREICTHALFQKNILGTYDIRFIKASDKNEISDLGLETVERITFKEIICGEQIIKLKNPIMVEAIFSEERYSLYYEPLDILISAPTLDECKKDFHEEFSILYQVYAKEVDEKLTEAAKELKRNLLSLCR
jgi:hypothetical protein